MHTLEPLFRTLEEAGYTACAHPRVLRMMDTPRPDRCMDCGALRALVASPSAATPEDQWHDGYLDYHRKLLLVP